MARTAITPTKLVLNSTVADPAGTATTAGAANGVSIASAAKDPGNLWLRVSNASGGTGNIIVKAGSQPSAIASGQGDTALPVATGTTLWAGPFETARFQQPDGSILVDTSVVMTISAFVGDFRYAG